MNPPASPCSPQAEGWTQWLLAPSSQDGSPLSWYPQLALSRKIHVTESFLGQPILAHPGCPAGFASCGWVWEVLGYWGEVCTGSPHQGSLNPPSSPGPRKALETGPDPSNHSLLLLTGRLRLGGRGGYSTQLAKTCGQCYPTPQSHLCVEMSQLGLRGGSHMQ